jgi:hypothetical protein
MDGLRSKQVFLLLWVTFAGLTDTRLQQNPYIINPNFKAQAPDAAL